MQSNSMGHGGCHRHTAAMGPHPRQQSTQQSTNIIRCGASESGPKTLKNGHNEFFLVIIAKVILFRN
jgi:hypothetical protein